MGAKKMNPKSKIRVEWYNNAEDYESLKTLYCLPDYFSVYGGICS